MTNLLFFTGCWCFLISPLLILLRMLFPVSCVSLISRADSYVVGDSCLLAFLDVVITIFLFSFFF